MPAPLQSSNVRADLAGKISANLMKAMEAREDELDQEIAKLDNLDEDDLEGIRQQRRKAMLEMQKRKGRWLSLGHGEYSETSGEMDFFSAGRNSPKVVAHFSKPDTNIERSEIVDKHLEKLAKDFIDIRFIKVNVERHPFVTSRLRICVIPSIVLIKEQQMFHTMIGFDELGGTDEFSSKDLVNVLRGHGMMTPYTPDWKDKRAEIINDPDAVESDVE